MIPLLFAAVSAIAVQPLIFIIWVNATTLVSSGSLSDLHDFKDMVFWVSLVAAPFVVFIGIPIFLALRRFNRATMPNLATVGFLVPCTPLALLSWPGFQNLGYTSGGSWNGHYIEFVTNGVTTFAGWVQYIASTAEFGLQGLIGAITFLGVWRYTQILMKNRPA